MWKYDTVANGWNNMISLKNIEQPENQDPAAGPLTPGALNKDYAYSFIDADGTYWLMNTMSSMNTSFSGKFLMLFQVLAALCGSILKLMPTGRSYPAIATAPLVVENLRLLG